MHAVEMVEWTDWGVAESDPRGLAVAGREVWVYLHARRYAVSNLRSR